MEKTSEWLRSFNSNQVRDLNSIASLKKPTEKTTQTISITGGKGGVGKTSVSLKMAKELAAQGNKVLLIDCDYNLSNTAIKLGLPLSNTFYDLVSAEKSFQECLYQEGSFHLLSACNGSIDLFDASFRLEEIIIDIMTAHEKEYDYILLDCPAGLSRESLVLNAYCDHRILIVTPDRSSITDSYSLIKVLNKKFGVNQNHLLVNMVNTKPQYVKVIQTLSETVENFLGCRTKILGGIKKLDTQANNFDQYFLARGKNSHHENFLKVVHKLTDELSANGTEKGSQAFHPKRRIEQEVH
ncbi:MAG: AAA family ATPase [Halobacteriovoraceae bacterium]|jgi:flagellar biosynthesis protein FlhG|nr:AAA family ATPase [Halobacteriovoraceae bacterium]